MLIVNADDFGRSAAETDAALRCYEKGRLTSVSAMMFMKDSERAAQLANERGLEVGLHLNFSEEFTNPVCPAGVRSVQERLVQFLRRNKYMQLLYNPFLRCEFAASYKAQANEFARLFGRSPSHVDGHHHMHLCANMLFSDLIPPGTRVRRNFSFWPGEKSLLNRTYRSVSDRWLARRYRLTEYFFDLTQSIQQTKLERLAELARRCAVEVMTHPVDESEFRYLMGPEFNAILQRLEVQRYTAVQ